ELREKLPEFMVPSAFVLLDALPLTPNGKIDRRALPEPAEEAYARDQHVAPSSHHERALAELWHELLGVQRVGVRDDFFALGGHSLLATRLISRVRGTFGVELPIQRVFAAPRLGDMAREIAALAGAARPASSPPLEPQPRPRELPLS